MTTIALHFANGVGTVAADGRETNGDGHICNDFTTKILHTKCGDVLACSGDVTIIETVIRHWGEEGYAEAVLDCLSKDSGMTAIYYDAGLRTWGTYSVGMNEDGKTYEYRQDINYNYAVGNGAQYAVSAMDFGCDAVGAVEFAATRDSCTGGRIEQWTPDSVQPSVEGTTLPDHIG